MIEASRGHVRGLDALRGIAAMAVVAFHVFWFAQLNLPTWLRVTLAAQFGLAVQMFFVLSAFCLCLRYDARLDTAHDVRAYCITRLFRIVPLYLVLLAVWLAINAWHLNSPKSFSQVILNVAFLVNTNPGHSIVWAGWTLGVEMTFYAIFPILISTLHSLRSSAFALIVSIPVSLAYCIDFPTINGQSVGGWLSFPAQLPFFIAGIFAYRVYLHLISLDISLRTHISTILLIASPIVWAGIGYFGFDHHLFHGIDIGPYLISAVFVPIVISQALKPAFILSNPITDWLGVRAYSIYLIHPVVIYFLIPLIRNDIYGVSEIPNGRILPFALSCIVVYTLVVISSSMGYALIEKPFMALGKRMLSREKPANTHQRSDARALSVAE